MTANRASPICPALLGKGAPDPQAQAAYIPEADLPRCCTCTCTCTCTSTCNCNCNCRCSSCSGLLRPHVVWFGESLDEEVLEGAQEELEACDLCLVVGTSSVVYPAAMFAPSVAARGVPVAEFNMETTPATQRLGGHGFFFEASSHKICLNLSNGFVYPGPLWNDSTFCPLPMKLTLVLLFLSKSKFQSVLPPAGWLVWWRAAGSAAASSSSSRAARRRSWRTRS